MVCQEFRLGTVEALRQLAEEPYGLSWTVIDMRGFARAYEAHVRGQESDMAIGGSNSYRELIVEFEREEALELLRRRSSHDE